MTKISKQLSGIAGEYFVAAEISRRGYLAAITLRNSDGIDILVSNPNGDKSISIQVKTTQNKRKWVLTQKVENETSDKKFFIFVNIPLDKNLAPEYLIIKSTDLASKIYSGHRSWLNSPGKKGQKRNNTNIRQFDPQYFNKDELLDWTQLIDIIEKL
ncbi:hypothetical protein QW060_26245 [Myroides ceti]|uniref:Aspartate ammonia-lyase n=1 Tax=Paenimyroides ceti TaxID=395087 RepID=A0ABT8D0C5_9FLAO|nr:hypothetical protein [Paenimyroides ceti]MDN3706553.1 hypothetical protein [Paenimyroides ceti]MDN3710293.1 hypothetical protein [Paenimyroides ceti]MDN3710331.1 hypothetical protein [Paenimyroides ceti]